MEKERCMLRGVGLVKEFLAEEVGTACYLVNRSPSLVLGEKTPQEVFGYCSVPKAEPRYRSCYMQRIVNMFYRLVSQVLYKL
jgi:hypothetical protein